MARPTTVLVIFFISFNLLAGMMMAQGIDTMLGIDTEVGTDDRIEEANEETERVNTGSSLGDTLFGMYNTLANGIGTIYDVVFAGPVLLERAGIPGYIAKFMAGVFTFVVAIDVASFIRGFNL